MCNSCCVSDVYNILIEYPKDMIRDAPLEGAGCFIGSCCVSRSQSELDGRAKTRTFEFHPVKNEREMIFFRKHPEYV